MYHEINEHELFWPQKKWNTGHGTIFAAPGFQILEHQLVATVSDDQVGCPIRSYTYLAIVKLETLA